MNAVRLIEFMVSMMNVFKFNAIYRQKKIQYKTLESIHRLF
jgi:hypothetical protein